jgi:putative flippase GtrA
MRNKTVKKILAYTWFRYLLVGLGAVLIDIALYFLFIRLSLFDPSAAKRISFSAGAFWSYLNNKNFTFLSAYYLPSFLRLTLKTCPNAP